jgi:hypothetical protein
MHERLKRQWSLTIVTTVVLGVSTAALVIGAIWWALVELTAGD